MAGPIAAIFALDNSCSMTMWAALGLAAIAAYVLFIAGIAAFVGAWIGRADTVEYQPRRGVVALVVVGTIGVFAWIAAVASNSCP